MNGDIVPRLTIGVASMRDAWKGFRFPEFDPSVRWVLVVQKPEGDPEKALKERNDITVIISEETGLSRSRNLALDATETPWLLLCDDDIIVDVAGALDLLDRAEIYSQRQRTGAVWGRLKRDDGEWMARYPSDGKRLWLRGAMPIQSASLLLNAHAMRQARVRFEAGFGLGSPYPSGEEYIVATDLIKRGWAIRHADVIVGIHPGASTGSKSGPVIDRARAAVFGRVFGPFAWIIRARYAIKHTGRLGGISKAIRFTLGPSFVK